MKLAAIASALDSIAPFGAAADWDNVGLIFGEPERDVTKILVSNEVTLAVIEEARAAGCQLLLSYHPPLLRGVHKLLATGPSRLLYAAARHDVAIISVHTAWDAAMGGVNDVLAHSAGLATAATTPLADGMGRFGTLARPTQLVPLAQQVRERMGLAFALVAQSAAPERAIRHIAVAAGAGDAFADAVVALGADVFVTGELRHHVMLALLASGVDVLCLTHCGSERASLAALCNALQTKLGAGGPHIGRSRADTAPWRVV